MVESITMGPIGTIGVVPAGGDRTALASTPAELAEDDAEAVGESTATKLATGAADAPDADEAQRRARPVGGSSRSRFSVDGLARTSNRDICLCQGSGHLAARTVTDLVKGGGPGRLSAEAQGVDMHEGLHLLEPAPEWLCLWLGEGGYDSSGDK